MGLNVTDDADQSAGDLRMEAVQKYIRRAEEAREEAARSKGTARHDFEAIAANWEMLAAETNFPADGIGEDDLNRLWREGLIERSGQTVLVAESGREILTALKAEWSDTAATPARGGTCKLHHSVQ